MLEHVCHLRDIEREGYSVRVRRILTEDVPSLAGLDGDALAVERRYNDDDLARALAAFESARAETMAQLCSIGPTLLARTGYLEHVGSISLHDLLRIACEHDAEHLTALTRFTQ